MSQPLYARVAALVADTLGRYPGAFLVWCDPRGDWRPLLERAASAAGFALVDADEPVGGEVGGLRVRAALQTRIDRGESFVLRVPAEPTRLGWLWAQSLLAERVFDRPLRDQLADWGWRPHSLTAGDDEVADIARARVGQDPADWGGGGLRPEPDALLQVLAAGFAPDDDQRTVLDLTVEAAGLPPIDRADLDGWRVRCLALLLVTQAHDAAPAVGGGANERLVPADRRAFALDLLSRWLDRLSLRDRLPEAIAAADPMTGLAAAPIGASFPRQPFVSLAAETALFSALCRELAALDGRGLLEALAARRAELARHAAGLWGDPGQARGLPWPDLHRLADAARALLAASPDGAWASPTEVIAWYTGGGWRVDRAGQEIARPVARHTSDLLAVLGALRAAFRARWEEFMIAWSESWTAAGCPMPALTTAGELLRQQLQTPRATAVVVCDALRYDLGAELTERVNARERTERARLSAARAPLPSITALGMGAALPIAEEQLQAEVVDGKWQLLHRTEGVDLSQAAVRRAWLTQHAAVPADAHLSVSEALASALPAPAPGRSRLYLTDAMLDKLGHDDELEALGGGAALDRYTAIVERLRDAGWRRVLFVTDHGFIHWPSGEELNVTPPAPDPAYSSRRAFAYPASTVLIGPHALAPGGRWRVAVPRGAASFCAYGGLGYFHGGASLQEWIIPFVAIEWPLQAHPVNPVLPATLNVLSAQPRVTLGVERPSLLVEDSIPRQVEVLIRDAASQAILFRSEPTTLAPTDDEVAVPTPAVAGQSAARGADLRVQVRDAHTEAVLASAPGKLMIDLSDW